MSMAPVTVKNVDLDVNDQDSLCVDSEGDHHEHVKRFLAELQEEINQPGQRNQSR